MGLRLKYRALSLWDLISFHGIEIQGLLDGDGVAKGRHINRAAMDQGMGQAIDIRRSNQWLIALNVDVDIRRNSPGHFDDPIRSRRMIRGLSS